MTSTPSATRPASPLRPSRQLLACLLGLLCLLMVLPLQAQPRLEVTTLGEQADIGRWISLLPTRDPDLSASRILDSAPGTLPWMAGDTDSLTIGLSNRIWWLRLETSNAGPGVHRVLQLNRATLGSIQLYSRDEDRQWHMRESGALALLPRGDVDAPGYAFRLWLPPGDATYLIRLESSYSIRSPIQLNTENAVFRQGQNSAGLFGWGLGLLAGLAMAALVLARRRIIRKRLTLAYVLILLTGCVHILADRGVLGAWWIALPGVQHGMLQLGIMLQQLSFIWFTLLFLHNRGGLTAAWHRILLALLGVEALALVLGVAINRHETVAIVTLLPIAAALLLLAACWSAWRRRLPGCGLLFWASALILVSRSFLLFSLFSWLSWDIEPYQWLLAVQVIHALLLLLALLPDAPSRHASAAPHTPPEPVPATPLQAALGQSQRPDVSGLSLPLPLTVLVVEDNPWVQQVLVGLLSKQGVDCITATDGMQALELLERQRPDVVLMDCDLPELDGLSATQVWRQRERERGLRPLPILAITAHVSAAQRQQALDAGMNDFLAKPVDMRTLRDTLICWTRLSSPVR